MISPVVINLIVTAIVVGTMLLAAIIQQMRYNHIEKEIQEILNE